jgi:Tfp pilus assembly protein PilV
MAELKIKAASLVEIIIAMLILSISLTAAALVFSHFANTAEIGRRDKIDAQIYELIQAIKMDSLFPENIQPYKYPNFEIRTSASEFSDSIVKVELIYTDSINAPEIKKSFYHAKN